MVTEQLRIARQQRKIAQVQADRDIIMAIIKNPAIEIVGSFVLLEVLQRNHVIGGMGTDFEEAACMTAVSLAVGLQQIAPLLPDIIETTGTAGSQLLGTIGKSLPLLAAVK